MLAINDAPVDRRAVRVHIENGKKDSDPPRSRFQDFGFIDLDDVGDTPSAAATNRIGIGRARRAPDREKTRSV